jgi:septum formation protein
MSLQSNSLIYLASASPRRSALLTQIEVVHRVVPVDVDETRQPGESPAVYVVRLAQIKAETLWQRLSEHERLPVLGSDTTVALGSDVLGKPADASEAKAMLRRLSGRTHQVYTGVALRAREGLQTRLSVSDVTFRTLTDREIDAYWETGEPADKAGAYAVQGRAAVFIESIRGSYSGIMGLPLFETAELLATLDRSALTLSTSGAQR